MNCILISGSLLGIKAMNAESFVGICVYSPCLVPVHKQQGTDTFVAYPLPQLLCCEAVMGSEQLLRSMSVLVFASLILCFLGNLFFLEVDASVRIQSPPFLPYGILVMRLK